MQRNNLHKVREILDREGWSYQSQENDILLLVSFGGRKWKMIVNCSDEGLVCCFGVFPWPVAENRLARVWEGLNKLNLLQRRGCFMVNPADTRVIYRCGIQIVDEYASYAEIKNIFLAGVASVHANWEHVHRLIHGVSDPANFKDGGLRPGKGR